MSIATNNVVRELGNKSLFESLLPVTSTACTYNQGDLIAFDATNNILVAVTGTGSSANIVGVSRITLSKGLIPSPYQGTAVDASQAIEDAGGPTYGNVYFFNLKTGDAWQPGQLAYLTSDPQTLTSAASGNAVGMFQGRAIASAASGSVGDFLIGSRYNQPGLIF